MLNLFTAPQLIADLTFGEQYLDRGWFRIVVTVCLVFFVLWNIRRAKSGQQLYIRRIAGLNAIDEAIGRATEMGRPVLMVPGLSDNVDAIAVQALNICAHATRIAAKFANPILLCCYSPAVYTVAQEMIRDVYQQEGVIDRYDQDSVRFVSDRQFAFAAGVSGMILREQTAATFFLGQFYAESLIFAESANSIGAIQVASSTEVTQTPFFIAACDYVLIGDEFYAASAYLSREPVLVGSLTGQDWGKLLLIGCVVFGSFVSSAEMFSMVTNEKSKGIVQHVLVPDPSKPAEPPKEPGGKPKPAMMEGTRKATLGDAFFQQLLKPQKPEIKVVREMDPNFDPKKEEGGGE